MKQPKIRETWAGMGGRKNWCIGTGAAAAVLLCAATALLSGGRAGRIPMGEAKVKLCPYTGIEVTAVDTQATQDEVEAQAALYVDYYNMSLVSDRTVVREGDTVHASVYVYDPYGNLIDDGMPHEGYVTVGGGSTYPEVEEALVGMDVGEEREISLTFPDPYEYMESLSGMEATAKVRADSIRDTENALSLDVLTDEQAALVCGVPGVDTVEGFYAWARENIEEGKRDRARSSAYHEICEYLLANCVVKPFPGAELERRLAAYMAQTRQMCADYYGMSMEDYCASIGMTEEEYRETISISIRETIALELIFTAIADAEGITYPEEDFQAYAEEAAAQTGQAVEDVYAQYGEEYVRNAFRIEYVVDWLIDNADVVREGVGG